jgi:hypothetical protein
MIRNGVFSRKSPLALSAGTIPLLYDEETKDGINNEIPQHQIAGYIKRKHGMHPVSKGIFLQDPIPQDSHE